jgi:hemerythrin superfamily protein
LNFLLSDHHRRIEVKCRDLLACASGDDSRELVTRWSELETELLDHIAAEEKVILPTYAAHASADADCIRDQHARICALFMPLGVDVELHDIRLARLRELTDLLAAHAAAEDAGMYPWAVLNLSPVDVRMLNARIGRWVGLT